MTGFWIGAALMALAALALWVLPRRRWPAILAGLAMVAAALLLYRVVSNWQPQPQSAAEQQARADIARLQRSASGHPADAGAWRQLGQKYLQYEQYRLAEDALNTANRIERGGNAATLASLAEALALDGDETNDAQVAPLFESVLRLEPRNAKALFYTGLQALQQGRLPVARERFTAMLGPEVPTEVQAALQKQIRAIDAELAATKGGRDAANDGATRASAARSGAPGDGAVDASTVIELEVSVATAVRAAFDARAKQGAPLFVFVRNPHGGPPLAVKRLSATLPMRISLSARDAMIAGNGIQPHQQVTVAARLSVSGAPTGGSGDIYGEASAVAGGGKPVAILLDKTAP